jgi:hypothetical protein
MRLCAVTRTPATLAVGAALWIQVAATSPPQARIESAATLVDLKGTPDLQKQFNSDRGHVRLVLLLSPT